MIGACGKKTHNAVGADACHGSDSALIAAERDQRSGDPQRALEKKYRDSSWSGRCLFCLGTEHSLRNGNWISY